MRAGKKTLLRVFTRPGHPRPFMECFLLADTRKVSLCAKSPRRTELFPGGPRMVNRPLSRALLAGTLVGFSLAGLASAAAREGATLQDPVGSMLSYAPLAQAAAPAQTEPASTEDCRGCHAESLTRFNRTYHASLEESC